MFQDKKPSKWMILGALLVIVLIGFVILFGMRAQAADKFLPIQQIKTASGIDVWVIEDHSLPIIVMKFAFVESGSVLDPYERQGLARMLSNTMDEGAGTLDSQAFQKELADHSISLTFSSSRDAFSGELEMLKRHEDKAFHLIDLTLNSPRFDAEPVARMRDANLSRIKSSLSEPDWMAARLIADRAFEGHSYARNSGGTLSSLGRITPDDLRKAKHALLTKDRLLVVVAGDVDPKTIGAKIDGVFAKLPATASVVKAADTKIANAGKIYLFAQDIPQTFLEIMLPAFGQEDKDFYALEVLNYIYGGAGFGSRLMDEVREKKGLTYGIYSDVQPYRHANAFHIATSTKNESASEVIDIVKAQMLRLQTEKVGDKELADAKSYLTGSLPLSLTSTDDIAGIVLGMRTNDFPTDYLDTYAANINKVTADDLMRVAKRVLKPEVAVIVLVGKPQNVENVELIKELPNVK